MASGISSWTGTRSSARSFRTTLTGREALIRTVMHQTSESISWNQQWQCCVKSWVSTVHRADHNCRRKQKATFDSSQGTIRESRSTWRIAWHKRQT